MRKFLASVGNAKLLGKQNGTVYHIADIRTLTESTLSFSNTQEEVRAGQGAQLYGRFSHDSGMTVTLTDAMFDLNYVALQIGDDINRRGGAGLASKELSSSNISSSETKDNKKYGGTADVPAGIVDIGNACGLDHKVIWYRAKGCGADTEWQSTVLNDEQTTFEISNQVETTNGLCLQYFVDKPEARVATVYSNFIPAELILIITTQLFAGDASAPETGKPVGEITIKIPRFSLDGNFDLSMAMSSAASISLAGTALAVDDGGCEGKGVYAEIIEVLTGSGASSGLKEILIDEDCLEVGKKPVVYGMYVGGGISSIGPATAADKDDGYHVTSGTLSDAGAFSAAGSYTFAVGIGENAITDTVTVA